MYCTIPARGCAFATNKDHPWEDKVFSETGGLEWLVCMYVYCTTYFDICNYPIRRYRELKKNLHGLILSSFDWTVYRYVQYMLEMIHHNKNKDKAEG